MRLETKIFKMDVQLFIEENFHVGLTLIDSNLYRIADDKSQIQFHDENAYELFYIHLNEYINTEFRSPLNYQANITLLDLTIQFFKGYNSQHFVEFINVAKHFKEFLFKKRAYKYYISPYDIKLETSLAELINIQANYSKHSFYHLKRMKDKLRRIFQSNNIQSFESEDYNDHLSYFKEAVLDDRLCFNGTKIVEEIGKYFLAFHALMFCDDTIRIRIAIQDCLRKPGQVGFRNIVPPENMTDEELFFWEVKFLSYWRFDSSRLSDLIPITSAYLTEKGDL